MKVSGGALQNKRGTIGVGFDIHGETRITKELEVLVDRIPWFEERAIGTLYRRLPVQARRDIQREYNIRAGRVREHMAIRYLKSGTARRGGVRLFGQWKRGIGMMQYPGTRQVKRGVSYSVYRGIRKVEPDSFIARLLIGKVHHGNLHVAQRYGPKVRMQYGRYKGQMRQKIETQYRSTVAQHLARGRRPERLADYATNLLRTKVESQIDSYMKRR